LKICPTCKTQNLFDGAQFCRECGAPLEKDSTLDQKDKEIPRDNDEFVVTESANSGGPELIGMEAKGEPSLTSDEGLEIKSSASMLDDEANGCIPRSPQTAKPQLIGDSAPPIPPVSDYEPPVLSQATTEKIIPASKEKAEFKKLSQEELANIRKNLYQAGGKSDMLPKENHTPENSRPPRPDLPLAGFTNFSKPKNEHKASPAVAGSGLLTEEISPAQAEAIRSIEDPALASGVQKAHKVRGLAYFKGNFIQIVGNPYLHAGDEVSVNEKHYLLKPKKLGRKVTIGLFAGGLAIILFIIGLQFIDPTVSGKGEIVGMILNENNQPYLEGARVTIPALNKTTKSNAQGFFRFELIPTGSYELAYELSGNRVGRANATVTSDQTTLMAFGETGQVLNTPSSLRTESPEVRTFPPGAQKVEERKISQPETQPRAKAEFGKVEMKANVPDARLTVDDKVLGSGNNIYANIKVGERTIKVDKPGYSEYTAAIKVDANQTSTISANLQPVSKEAAVAASVEDHITRGNLAFASGDHQKAIDEYTSALNLQPGSKDAYQKRAEAYSKAGSISKAVEDYIRLGEMYRLGQLNDKAISSFSTALAYEPKNKIALVGRGGARLDNGEYSPALNDFEAALKIDDQFYPALFGGGVSQFKLGNNKQADKYLKNAYKLNQSDPYLYQYMMLNYLALDDVKKLKRIYTDYKAVASPQELAELKSSSRFASIIRLIEGEER